MPEKNKVAKTPDKKAPAKKSEKKSKFHPVKTFKEMWSELKKVTWPSAKDVIKSVGIVIVCVLIVGVCIWVFDYLAHAVVGALLNLFKA